MKQYGPHAMADMMRKMGIGCHIDETYSLCVGSADISVFDMVSAYNTFPSKGVYVTPLFVTRVEDRFGNSLGEFHNPKMEAISEHTAYLMANLMQGVVNSGTGVRLRAKYGLKGEIAGKTGTTNNQSDGWFIGYTPKLTAGVWVGGEDRSIHFESLSLGGGSNMALPIWGIFMKKVLENGTLGISETDRFIAPAGVSLNLNCDGGDAAAQASEEEDDNYFFE
jgi:penicillin-binding protein 1A